MKALVYEDKGRIQVQDRDIPTPAAGELLVRVSHTGICGTDLHVWHGGMKRVKPPVILGHEFSGVVEQAGSSSSEFEQGDRVTVEPLITCGVCPACRAGFYNVCSNLKLLGVDTDGAMAHYVVVPEHRTYRLSDRLSLKDAAFVEPLAVCVHMVERSGLESGQTCLVVGGGPIGLITAFAARLKGANVLISEMNAYRIQLAQGYGFDVINPLQGDLRGKIRDATAAKGVDVSFEATGSPQGTTACVENTGIRGTVAICGLPKQLHEVDTYQFIAKELSVYGSRVYTRSDYEQALALIESGRFKPEWLISRTVSLDEAIEHGFEAIQRGDALMKVLISLENEAGR
ncbi:zinc-dependent alcohol dehydrogenase [Cohnella caldifontis]|uniref:zinc-dependent alcohol dehydrogenase n=1 Tax=Cohnella caldifontis TaxID=3027471 RepID=UPI0023EC1E51|nr:alcohol dehydrogenase catalytic domain-containing protein [Cohnella sp. YIM B05605]